MAEFDSIDDLSQKFSSTVVLFEKKAALVKSVDKIPEGFVLLLGFPNARAYKAVLIDDPALDFKNFQLGYVNGGTHAAWWYRKPQKQWSQGLRSNQLGWCISSMGAVVHDNFGFSRPFINMLENVYPSVEDVKKALTDGKVKAMAWHRDFALSYDDIHEDHILEYHGRKIGHAISPDMSRFKIMSDFHHLQEALVEARHDVYP